MFDRVTSGPAFPLFGSHHLIALACLAAFLGVLFRLRTSSPVVRRRVAWTMALVLWANEIGFHVWNAVTGQWTLQTMLPVHVCSVLAWIAPLTLVTRSRILYPFVYFLGLAAASQGILTPDLGPYDFPHYRAFQTFISHGGEIAAALWLTWAEGLRPTWASLWRVWLSLNAYAVVAFGINSLLGSNYLFVNRKPDTASLLDVMPAWPWYIAILEGIALVAFVLCYLPFAVRDYRDRRLRRQSSP